METLNDGEQTRVIGSEDDSSTTLGDGESTRARRADDDQAPAVAVRRGAIIGRYVVLEEVGRGGMGRVYRAYDPKLGREVAIKQLSLRGDSLSTEGAARMLREAQAMAKLSHPNVVPVYDVEGDGADLFIAMEFVPGQTLRQWLDAAPRSWAEIVAIFREAGEGLAAAHRAGLVHRDFKPGNVMVGEDGRARVMDFGLARADNRPDDGPDAATGADLVESGALQQKLTQSGALVTSEGLTEAGTVMGTPAYMAPEQHLDDMPLSLASDQYAFCVTLWEALYRERPFVEQDYTLLVKLKLAGPPSAPAGTQVPPWLHRVIERGLAADANERWASMQDLLVALGRDPAARRRTLVAGGLGVVLIGSLGLAAVQGSSSPSPCEDAAALLADVWTDDSAPAITQALEATERAYAARTATIVVSELEEYASGWIEGHTDACQATHVRRAQSDDVLDRRMACLDTARSELAATVRLLSHDVSTETLERASQLVSGLPRLERCSDIEALLAEVPPPEDPATKQRVEQIEEQLAELRPLSRAGRVADVLEAVQPIVQQARDTGYEPIHARAELAYARSLEDAGEFEDTLDHAERAYLLALESGDDRTAAFAALKLGYVLGDHQGKTDPAHRWLDTAGALARRVDAGGPVEGWYHNIRGTVLKAEGRTNDAIASYDAAEAIFVEIFGPDHENVGRVLNNAGIALNEHQRPKEALPKLQRAVEIKGIGMGPMHPSIGRALTNLGLVLYALHRYEEALERHTEARDVFAASLGEDHPHYAAALSNMGMALSALERLDEAEPLLRESLRIKEARLGPDHRGLVPQLLTLAELMGRLNDTEQTLALLQRAQAILVAHHGDEHPFIALNAVNLGSIHTELGHHDKARRSLDRAIAYYEREDGPDAPSLAPALTALAGLEIKVGDTAKAERLLVRVREIQIAHDVPKPALALTRFRIAELKWDRVEERDEAVEMARRALEEFGDEDNSQAEQIRQWLAEHG